MKKICFTKNLVSLFVIAMLCVTMTSCDKLFGKHTDDNMPECHVDKNDLSFSSKKDDSRELHIVCTGKWKISNIPGWLTAESTEGNGSTSVKFATTMANRNSSPNEGMLRISFADNPDATETIYVKQQGGAIAGCEVTPSLIVTLSNGIAFDFKFDKDVARYYRGYIEASSAGRMSEEEIIEVLETDFSRHVPSEDEVADFDGLRAGTRYIVYTVGYDKYGNRGDLVSTEVSTLGTKSNEPVGRISNLRRNGAYWEWTVTKSATCNGYYMMSSENYYVANASDVLQAWWLQYAVQNGTISEYVNGADWRQEVADGSMFAVWTRGVDSHGNMSGKIDWKCISSTTSRSASDEGTEYSHKSKTQCDHSGRKLSPGEYKLYRIS